jgi:Predicted transcriptional regulator
VTSRDKLVEEVYEHLAMRIREERERQGLSMLAVAERAGLSQQMVSYVERSMRNPSLGTLIRVCDVLKLDIAKFIREAMRAK